MPVVLRFSLLLLAGCCLSSCGRQESPLHEPDRRTDPFSVVLGMNAAEPDVPPALDGDTLNVRVEYSGGCRDHDFEVESTVRRDTTVLSIRHDGGSDDCDALVYDELRLALPEPIPATGPVLLRNPKGGPPFRLR